MRYRLIALAIMVWTIGSVDAAAQPLRTPTDSLFAHQLSYFHGGGTARQRQASNSERADTVTIVPGVTLDAQAAWALTTGNSSVVVAVLDDGFFYWHDDLRPNIWRNPGESGLDERGLDRGSNGFDDDGNGYIDDNIGWDFAFDDPDPDPYVFDGMDRTRVAMFEHSTPALGIIGARGDNGIGVAGINWHVSLMLLKIGAQGIRRGEIDTLRAGRAARAIRYAVDEGARIINWSGFVSYTRPDQLVAVREALEYAADRDVVVVLAAGNDGRDLDSACTLYPQCFDLPNVIAVAESDLAGRLIRYEVPGGGIRGSNYGPNRVHIAAIGANFTTAGRDGRSLYALSGGTSNAAPVVTGVAALILSVRPDLSPNQVVHLLLVTATPVPEMAGKVGAGGVVNAYRAVEHATRLPLR